MISIGEFKNLLEGNYSDKEIIDLKTEYYKLSEIIINFFIKVKTN